MSAGQFNQCQLELQQQVEEAVRRVATGQGTVADAQLFALMAGVPFDKCVMPRRRMKDIWIERQREQEEQEQAYQISVMEDEHKSASVG